MSMRHDIELLYGKTVADEILRQFNVVREQNECSVGWRIFLMRRGPGCASLESMLAVLGIDLETVLEEYESMSNIQRLWVRDIPYKQNLERMRRVVLRVHGSRVSGGFKAIVRALNSPTIYGFRLIIQV